MKHCWFITFLAVIALAGCSSEDSLKETQPLPTTSSTAIAFNSRSTGYANTRAAVGNLDSIKADSVGVFAMFTSEGKKYDPTKTDGTAETEYAANLMQNFKLYHDGTNWTYGPLRFWPASSTEYLSFMAYSPYDANCHLYQKNDDGMALSSDYYTGSYVLLSVSSDKSKMKDYFYNDGSVTANMQCYSEDNGTTITTKVNDQTNSPAFTTPDDGSVPRVLLTMKHATARIAIDVSSSALANPLEHYKDNTTFTNSGDGYEYTTKRITLNKVVLLGDNTSGGSSKPTGVFYPAGYLNLGKITDDKPLWVPYEEEDKDKIAITYNNTSSSVETVRGKGNFLLGSTSDWQPGADTYAPNIKGNQIVGWRTSVTPNGDGTYSAVGKVTEIGSAADGYLFIVPQDFSEGNAASNKLYLYVDYTVSDTEQNTSTNINGYVQLHENFEAGKAYVICIDLGLGGGIIQHTIVNHTEEESSQLFVDP